MLWFYTKNKYEKNNLPGSLNIPLFYVETKINNDNNNKTDKKNIVPTHFLAPAKESMPKTGKYKNDK